MHRYIIFQIIDIDEVLKIKFEFPYYLQFSGVRKIILTIYLVIVIIFVAVLVLIAVFAPIEEAIKSLKSMSDN